MNVMFAEDDIVGGVGGGGVAGGGVAGSVVLDLSDLHVRNNPYCIGHESGEAIFLRAWHSNFFHPVRLISGAGGIGKATFAYRIARYVLSGGRDTESLDVDFGSAICRQISGGSHGDLMVLESGLPKLRSGESGINKQISIDWVRRMIERSHRASADLGWRVYIIDKADDMSDGAANAILKLLEEPPVRSLFLIVCDSPYRLSAAFRSRCQEIRLQPLSVERVHDFLRLSELDDDPRVLESLSQLSGGAIGRALVWSRIGALQLYDDFVSCLSRSLAEGSGCDCGDIMALAEKVAIADSSEQRRSEQNRGESFSAFVTMVCDYLQRCILAFSGGGLGDVIRPSVDDGIIERLHGRSQDVGKWLDLYSLILFSGFKSGAPLRLDKQQTVIEILWRMRYGCSGEWDLALRSYD